MYICIYNIHTLSIHTKEYSEFPLFCKFIPTNGHIIWVLGPGLPMK